MTGNSLRRDVGVTSVVFLCGVGGGFNVATLGPAIQTLQGIFGLSLTEIGVLASLFTGLVILVATAVAGLVDSIGERRILLAAMAMACMGSAMSLALDSVAGLFLGRMVEGLSFLVVMLSGPAVLIRHTSERRRGAIMGVWSGFMPFGNAAALLLSPWFLAATGSWQAVWQAGSVLAAVAFALAYWQIPDGAPPRGGWMFNAAGLRRAMGNRLIVLLGLLFAVHSVVYHSLLQFMPVFNQDIVGLTLVGASFFAVVYCVVHFFGNVAFGQLLQAGHAPARLTMLIGVALTSLLLAMLAAGGAPLAFAAALMAVGFVIGGNSVIYYYVVSRQRADISDMPLLYGWMFQIQGLGVLVGPAWFGFFVDSLGTWLAGFAALIPFALATAIMARRMDSG